MSAPLPGGALPVAAWEQELAALDEHDEDRRVESAQDLLTRLEAALEDL